MLINEQIIERKASQDLEETRDLQNIFQSRNQAYKLFEKLTTDENFMSNGINMKVVNQELNEDTFNNRNNIRVLD